MMKLFNVARARCEYGNELYTYTCVMCVCVYVNTHLHNFEIYVRFAFVTQRESSHKVISILHDEIYDRENVIDSQPGLKLTWKIRRRCSTKLARSRISSCARAKQPVDAHAFPVKPLGSPKRRKILIVDRA